MLRLVRGPRLSVMLRSASVAAAPSGAYSTLFIARLETRVDGDVSLNWMRIETLWASSRHQPRGRARWRLRSLPSLRSAVISQGRCAPARRRPRQPRVSVRGERESHEGIRERTLISCPGHQDTQANSTQRVTGGSQRDSVRPHAYVEVLKLSKRCHNHLRSLFGAATAMPGMPLQLSGRDPADLPDYVCNLRPQWADRKGTASAASRWTPEGT